MSEIVTLELPPQAVTSAKEVASRSQRRLEDVLVEWIDQAAAEIPVETLSDGQVLTLCDLQMEPAQQGQLSQLLARHREGELTKPEQIQLDELMGVYRRGLVRKARALKVAVERGLKPPLS